MDDREALLQTVAAITPCDPLEQEHRDATLDWIRSDAPIWRTAKRATPAEHLVSYATLVDARARQALLVDHRRAGLWLPPGGHVDPGEDPAAAAARELAEELGVAPVWTEAIGAAPLFVTRTTTIGSETPHLDVSLWFVFAGDIAMPLTPDAREFAAVSWWPFDAIRHDEGTRFDPNLPRFVAKLAATTRGSDRTRA